MSYDVVVLGGGAAGLNGALTGPLPARGPGDRRRRPRNAPAEGCTACCRPTGSARRAAERGRAEVRGYGGQIWPARSSAPRRDDDGFRLTLPTARTVRARRLLVATGLVDELPDVPACASGGVATWCTARTATAGRCGTGDRRAGGGSDLRAPGAALPAASDAGPGAFAHTAAARRRAGRLLAARGVRVVTGGGGVEWRTTGSPAFGCATAGRAPAPSRSHPDERPHRRLAALGLKAVPHPSGIGSTSPSTRRPDRDPGHLGGGQRHRPDGPGRRLGGGRGAGGSAHQRRADHRRRRSGG